MTRMTAFLMCFGALISTTTGSAWAQTAPAVGQSTTRQAASSANGRTQGAPEVVPPAGYVIGVGDELGIKFWEQADLSGDVVVRPDGKISVPLLHDVQAAGQTPQQLSEQISAVAKRYVQDPNVTVIIRQINSRAVFITGRVVHAGRYPLSGSTSILQLIAIAGGFAEWADQENVMVMRSNQNRFVTIRFNYKDVMASKNLDQNIDLQPGDTVIVR
jgi:polysaccharide export outer membrane protein